ASAPVSAAAPPVAGLPAAAASAAASVPAVAGLPATGGSVLGPGPGAWSGEPAAGSGLDVLTRQTYVSHRSSPASGGSSVLARTVVAPGRGRPPPVINGRTPDRSARSPEALTAPAATASCQLSRPVARHSQVCMSVSTTFGGVPRL